MSDYRDFWNNERWKPYDKYSKHRYLSHMQNFFQNGASDTSEMVNIIRRFFIKKKRDHPILFKFYQLVVKIVNKELRIVF